MHPLKEKAIENTQTEHKELKLSNITAWLENNLN